MSRTLPIEFLGGLFCFIAFAALITFIIYKTLNRQAPPGAVPPVRDPQSATRSGINTILGKDGFWIRSNRLRPGSQIRYRYFVDNEPMDGTIIYHPASEGHFVYTGHIPAAIEILHVMDAGMQQDYEAPESIPPAAPIIPSSTFNARRDRSGSKTTGRTFSGPSAY